MYENIFTQIAANYREVTAWALPGASIGINHPEVTADGKYRSVSVDVEPGLKIKFTGAFLQSSTGDICYQVIAYNYQGGNVYAYVWQSELNYWTKTEPSKDGVVVQAQNVLNSLITYNQSILENNLLCARALELMNESGAALPVEYRKKLYALQSRLQARNNKIKESGYVTSVQEGTSPRFSVYNDTLTNFMASPGIGLVVTTTAIVIVLAIVALASAAVAYALFKTLNAESKADYGLSNELTADLIKYLPVPVYQKLMEENKANAEKAQKAIDEASGKSFMNTLKYLAIGYGGFYLIDKFLSKRQNK